MPPASRRRRLTGPSSLVTAAADDVVRVAARIGRPSRWRPIRSTPFLVLASTVMSEERRHWAKVSRPGQKVLGLNLALTIRRLECRGARLPLAAGASPAGGV